VAKAPRKAERMNWRNGIITAAAAALYVVLWPLGIGAATFPTQALLTSGPPGSPAAATEKDLLIAAAAHGEQPSSPPVTSIPTKMGKVTVLQAVPPHKW
jgi:hypothetical protein